MTPSIRFDHAAKSEIQKVGSSRCELEDPQIFGAENRKRCGSGREMGRSQLNLFT